jgi:signal transduction histidine kinase
MKSLWPRSLRGQMIALVLVGLGAAQVFGFIIYRMQHQSMLRSLQDQYVLARLTSVVRLLADTPPALHERIVHAASSPPLQLAIADKPILEATTFSGRSLRLRQQLAELMARDRHDIRIGLRLRPPPLRDEDRDDDDYHGRHRHKHAHKGATVMAVAVPLDDGRWLNTLSRPRPPERFWQWSSLLSVSLSALILSLLMIWMVRRITFPLGCLSAAADRFGRGEAAEPLPERGPSDIQHTIRAFNQMRARLERFVQDRTHMLAAISHDLRTPITALRVRAELIGDQETRHRIVSTLDEMQHMTEATLTFIREESAPEETRLIDLAALVESLCDDLSDTGKPVSFNGPAKIPYRCRVMSLKRALGNLVDNAVTYGQRARVTLAEEQKGLRIDIDDDGPGIAEPDMERVFEPFERLETSRSLETGGVGLGLAIARSIVRQHGGDITLANRPQGGLRTTVWLPREGVAQLKTAELRADS